MPKRLEEIDFKALSYSPDMVWPDVVEVPWDNVPVGPGEEFKIYARDVAGKSRSFGEFYTPENRSVAEAVERWLTRYSRVHTHPDLR